MKKVFNKGVALVVILALLITVMLPCMQFITLANDSLAEVSYNIWTKTRFAAFCEENELYYGEDPLTNGLTKQDWDTSVADGFVYGGTALRHDKKDEMIFTDAASQANKYISTVVHTATDFIDFEATLQITMRDGSDYLYPGVLFGAKSLGTWGQKNSGWYAGLTYNGAGSVKPAIEGYDATTESYKVDTPETFDAANWSNSNKFKLILKVQDTSATVTVEQSSTGASFTQTFTVPEGYNGGKVGVVFRGSNVYVHSMSIKEIESTASVPLESLSFPDFSQTNANAFKEKFDVYNGVNPDVFGMVPTAWEDAVSSGRVNIGGGFQVNKTDDMIYTDVVSQTNKYVTTFINNNKRYRNFELTVKLVSKTGANYIWPGIMFGVNQPEKWGTRNAGWFAGLYQNGNAIMPSIQGYDAQTQGFKVNAPEGYRSEAHSSTGNPFYGVLFWYNLTLRVEGSKATVTINQPDYCGEFSYTFDVPEGYTGGYVGLAIKGDDYVIYAVSLDDLGGKVIVPEPEEDTGPPQILDSESYNWVGANADLFKQTFVPYDTRDSKKGLTQTTWESLAEQNRVIVNSGISVNPTSDMVYTNTSEQYNNYLTTLINEKKKYRDFEMRLKVVSKTGSLVYSPAILFGVNEATSFGKKYSGWYADITIVDGGAVAPALGGYTESVEGFSENIPQGFRSEDYTDTGLALYGLFWYWLNVKVQGDKVTVTAIQPDYAGTFSYTFDIPVGYSGGYVGVLFRGDQSQCYALEFQELGGTAIDPTVNEYTMDESSEGKMKSDFVAYHSEKAENGELKAVRFNEHFEFKDNTLVHVPTQSITESNFSKLSKNNVTTLINEKQQYRDFTMTVTSKASGSDPEAERRGITLLFGVYDGVIWREAGYGFEIGAEYIADESRAFLKTYSESQKAMRGYTATSDNFAAFLGADKDYTYTLTVKKTTATLTLMLGSQELTAVYDLGYDYAGGYVGVRFMADATVVSNIKITDLGGEIGDTGEDKFEPVTELYVFGNELSNQRFLEDFEFYFGDNTAKAGLKKEDFGDHFSFVGILQHTPTVGNITISTNTEAYNKVISTALDTSQEYVDFNMKVKIGLDNGMAVFPSIVFGVQDPAEWLTADSGWIGGLYSNGYSEIRCAFEGYNNLSEQYHLWKAPDTHDNFYGLFWYWMEVTVRDGKMTVHINQPDNGNLDFSYTTDLPLGYKGGYVGLACRGVNHRIWSIEITDLGGEKPEGDVKKVKVEEVLASPVVETQTTTFAEDLEVPETVKVRCDDGLIYEIPVTWNFDTYNRFVRGEYVCEGIINDTVFLQKSTALYVGDATPQLAVRVVGDKDFDPVTIACVGDDLTYGNGPFFTENYPSKLQSFLGGEYDVRNFGYNYATAFVNGEDPYTDTSEYVESLKCEPDIVLIMLGKSDSSSGNWVNKADYERDYAALIESYKALSSSPTVYVLTTPYISEDLYSVNSNVIKTEIIPLQKKVAKEKDLSVIDVFDYTNGHTEWLRDGVYPNATGYSEIALYIAKNIALPREIESINLKEEKATAFVGKEIVLEYSFTPFNIIGDATVNWTSEDESVATVEGGVVTGISEGTTVITAECQGKTATIEINVLEELEPINLALDSAVDLGDFDYYYAEDATNGMTAVKSYRDYWTVNSDKGLARKSKSLGDMLQSDENVAALVYNKREFHNFMLEVEMYRTEIGQGLYPMVVFGIKDPTAYYTQVNGGIAVYATADGSLVVSGNINGENVTYTSVAPTVAGYNRTGPHKFEITVQYGALTVEMLESVSGEPLPEPLTVLLGDNDTAGYIALYGKDNPCGFKNLSITPFENSEIKEVGIKEIKKPQTIKVSVGTVATEIDLPETVVVVDVEGYEHTVNVEWSYDGYNRYKRGTYTINGSITDFVDGDKKILTNGKQPEINIEVEGDKDLISEGELKLDLLGISDLKDFKCYYTREYTQELSEYEIEEHWNFKDNALTRNDNVPINTNTSITAEIIGANLASVIYTGRKYSNFELEVEFKRDTLGTLFPMVVFGVEDPTKNPAKAESGGVAAFAFSDGRMATVSTSGIYEQTASAFDNYVASEVWHKMRVVVANGRVAVFVDDKGPFVQMLTNEQRNEGYVGLMASAHVASFRNLSIVPLADDKSTNTNGFDASKYPELSYAGDSEVVGAELIFEKSKSAEAQTKVSAEQRRVYNGGFLPVAIVVSLLALGYVIYGKKQISKKGEKL